MDNFWILNLSPSLMVANCNVLSHDPQLQISIFTHANKILYGLGWPSKFQQYEQCDRVTWE